MLEKPLTGGTLKQITVTGGSEDCEYTRAEAMKRLKEYRENIFGLVRLVKRREKRQ